MLTIDSELSGPLFDGEADKALDDYARAIERHIADYGVAQIRHHLDVVVRHPTGHYRDHVKDRAVAAGYQIHDSRVVYGPWLEGISERNRSTRFKGYATFRLMTGHLNRSAVYLAESIIDPYLERMGGRRA
jgi:hypothetical protein